jgi:hypothetical protein
MTAAVLVEVTKGHTVFSHELLHCKNFLSLATVLHVSLLHLHLV